MTGFQATTRTASWTLPARRAAGSGRHACDQRARLTLRRMFYLARHLTRGW